MTALDSVELERLFNDEAASEAARRAENANLNRMDTLRRMENAALDRLRSRDVINAAPRQVPPATSARPCAATLDRAVNAARQIPLPTSGAALANAGLRGLNAAGTFQLGGYGQGISDAAANWLGDQLPEGIQPIYDGLENLRRQVSGTINPAEALGRASRDLGSLRPPGLGTLGLPSEPFSAPLTCNLFGVGCPTRSPEGIPNNGSLPAAPPFYGGQSPGVQYNVTINFQWISTYTVTGLDRDFSGSKLGTFTGRITSISARKEGTSGAYIDVVHNSGASTYTYTVSGDDNRNQNLRFSITNIAVSRVDGQPDTGGNPSALPGAPSQPGIVPPTAPVPSPRIYPSNQPGTPTAPGALSPALAPNPATQPLSPSPTAPVPPAPPIPPQSPREDSPINPLIPLGILGGLGLGAIIPSFFRGGQNARTPPQSPTTTTTISTVCRFQEDTTSWGKLDTQYALLQTMQADQLRLLNQIDGKLGPQLGAGGIAGKLTSMGQIAAKTWNFLQVDRVLNVLTYVNTLHNAYMLSAGLTQTLFSAGDAVLNALGIKGMDSEGNETEINLGEAVGKWTESFLKTILGTETVDGMKAEWAKYNRIYQSAMNTIYTINSIVDSARSIMEVIGENTGKIGNALKRSGTVVENSYGWMQERLSGLSVGNNRWEKMFTRIEQTENVASSVETVSSDFVSIKENIDQLKQNRTELNQNLAAVGYGDAVESSPVKEQETEKKLDSEAPITLSDAKAGQ